MLKFALDTNGPVCELCLPDRTRQNLDPITKIRLAETTLNEDLVVFVCPFCDLTPVNE